VTHVLEVGKPYISGRREWPEGVEYNFRAGEHELCFFFRSPPRIEVEALLRGEAEFALVVDGPVIFLMYRFGEAINWSDAPYSWHLVPQDQRTLPDPEGPATRALLQIILVDAASGLILALRVVTFSPTFTRALHAAIRAQAENTWGGRAAYHAAFADLYRCYPTSADLLRCAGARTCGGK
jgi:hypothetical protein